MGWPVGLIGDWAVVWVGASAAAWAAVWAVASAGVWVGVWAGVLAGWAYWVESLRVGE